MIRRLLGVSCCLALLLAGGCSSSVTQSQKATQTAAKSADIAEVPSTAPASTNLSRLADGVLPTECSYVSDVELLGSLGVANTPTVVSKDPEVAPLPTTEAQAQAEDRTWPGLACIFQSLEAGEELTILVMPDTSPFFTNRQTSTCLPTYGKGSTVDLGAIKGWYCPTTNETPGEWVSYVHHGRLVTVNRTSKPTGSSPYKEALISYATWLVKNR